MYQCRTKIKSQKQSKFCLRQLRLNSRLKISTIRYRSIHQIVATKALRYLSGLFFELLVTLRFITIVTHTKYVSKSKYSLINAVKDHVKHISDITNNNNLKTTQTSLTIYTKYVHSNNVLPYISKYRYFHITLQPVEGRNCIIMLSQALENNKKLILLYCIIMYYNIILLLRKLIVILKT